MKPEKEIFEKIEAVLSKNLLADNYYADKSEFNASAFGSRYRIWKNDKSKFAIRLLWDGKESYFIVEESPFTVGQEPISWIDLVIVDFDKNKNDSEYFDEIVRFINSEIE